MDLTGAPPKTPARMFVTNTLGNPEDDEGWIPGILAPIAQSRKDANKIKREEPITVVIGNPPYKEKAKGRGGWVEGENAAGARNPRRWPTGCRPANGAWARTASTCATSTSTSGAGRRGRSLTTIPAANHGIVCFITVAGFLDGPGFQKMRDYLRRTCDDIWVIDCSPEGHQPEVNTRIFQGVQQPVCIVLASRSARSNAETPATVRFQALPAGHRTEKFAALGKLSLSSQGLGRLPHGLARSVSARLDGRVGHLSGARRLLHLQRLRRHAGPHLDHRARRRVVAAPLAEAHHRACGGKGNALPSASAAKTDSATGTRNES